MRRLYRSRDEAQLAGICAGLGDYLRLDPVFIRVVVLTVTFLTGILPGVLSYVAAWILVPAEPAPATEAPQPTRDGGGQAPA